MTREEISKIVLIKHDTEGLPDADIELLSEFIYALKASEETHEFARHTMVYITAYNTQVSDECRGGW